LISKDKYYFTKNKMEIVEIISSHQSENITEVTFRLMNDEEDMVRTDVIENNFFVEFGFDYLAPVTDWLFEDDSLEFDSEFPEYLDEDELMSFLNEFYVVYPDTDFYQWPKRHTYFPLVAANLFDCTLHGLPGVD
jgi:hypothetical protein